MLEYNIRINPSLKRNNPKLIIALFEYSTKNDRF